MRRNFADPRGARVPMTGTPTRPPIALFDMAARGQHRHHHRCPLNRCGGAVDGQAASRLGTIERIGRQIVSANIMPRLGEVRGHPAAHIAQADECDAGHVSLRIALAPVGERIRKLAKLPARVDFNVT